MTDTNDKATIAALSALHGALAHELAKQIREGSTVAVRGEAGVEKVTVSPGAAILNVARAFLHDNAISADLQTSPGLRALAQAMPSDEELERRMREGMN